MFRVMRRVWVKERELSSFGQLGPSRSFPSINVLISFSARVPIGRVIFEIGGPPIREELARDGPYSYLSFRNHHLIPLFYSPPPSRSETPHPNGIYIQILTTTTWQSLTYPSQTCRQRSTRGCCGPLHYPRPSDCIDSTNNRVFMRYRAILV